MGHYQLPGWCDLPVRTERKTNCPSVQFCSKMIWLEGKRKTPYHVPYPNTLCSSTDIDMQCPDFIKTSIHKLVDWIMHGEELHHIMYSKWGCRRIKMEWDRRPGKELLDAHLISCIFVWLYEKVCGNDFMALEVAQKIFLYQSQRSAYL